MYSSRNLAKRSLFEALIDLLLIDTELSLFRFELMLLAIFFDSIRRLPFVIGLLAKLFIEFVLPTEKTFDTLELNMADCVALGGVKLFTFELALVVGFGDIE